MKYVENVRRKVKSCFAPFPARTALKPQITGRLKLKLCNIEKIIFQSRPGLFVTGNLYLPKKLKKKNPAVLGLCGHSLDGKADLGYQAYSQALAQKGFVVFIIDPISQGERRQFFPRDGGKRPPLCHAHNLMGNQMLLNDDFFGTWRAWDAIRALDYLLSRPEVDPKHVGVTGNSGGGTLTSFATALDPRFTMAAPSCYVCSTEANIAVELPADSEQTPPRMLKAGLDIVDLLMAYAPRPTLILGQKHDFFSARHALIAAEEMKKVHSLLGKKKTAEVFIGPTVHGYSIENRQAMVAFFMKQVGIKGDASDEKLEILPQEDLNATPSGELRIKTAKRVFEFTAKKTAKLAEKRPVLKPNELLAKLAATLNLKPFTDSPSYRALYVYGSKHLAKNEAKQGEFAVETESGIQAILGVYGKTGSMMVPPT
ncbi:MAG: acetylxylan esterase, partial [Victivallales bacterium]|nr:acetylxylan esterase [Victivallales bacterium]